MILKENEVLRCPRCGGKTFCATAHVTQDWELDDSGTFVRCLNDCIEVTHEPDREDVWDCETCGYSDAGEKFVTTVGEDSEIRLCECVYDLSALAAQMLGSDCGDTLAELLTGAKLTEKEARQVTMQLCQALHVLHSMGAVHRDVKPENVILRGSDAVLIDFDAARIYKDESESDTQVLGTTGFAAPEQYGIFQSDERADIFSLGVLLNIMLTGKHPSREMAAGKMGRIVRKCTMTAPEQRYQSARALMEVL